MIKWSYTYGKNPYKFEVEKFAAVDIDDELDLLQAESWIKQYENYFI